MSANITLTLPDDVLRCAELLAERLLARCGTPCGSR